MLGQRLHSLLRRKHEKGALHWNEQLETPFVNSSYIMIWGECHSFFPFSHFPIFMTWPAFLYIFLYVGDGPMLRNFVITCGALSPLLGLIQSGMNVSVTWIFAWIVAPCSFLVFSSTDFTLFNCYKYFWIGLCKVHSIYR